MSQKLATIPHSREDDYGNIQMLSLIPSEEQDSDLLVSAVTSDKVKSHLKDQVKEEVVRNVLPELKAL